MRKFLISAGILAAVSAACVFPANVNAASTFSIIGGSPFTLGVSGGTFDPNWASAPDGIGTGTSITVFTSSNVGTFGLAGSPLGPVTLGLTFLGNEAGFTNISQALFVYDGSQPLFSTLTNANNDFYTATATLSGSGLIPFLFATYGGTGSIVGGAANGGPISSAMGIGFRLDSTDPSIAYAFFDDSGGNPTDADFDDMIVKLQISSNTEIGDTPLPAALPLFATGLGVMGLLGWRRKRKALAIAA